MRWGGGGGSSNVEDRRGMGGMAVGGGIGAIILALASMLLGVDLTGLGGGGGGPAPQEQQGGAPQADDPDAKGISEVLLSTELVWQQIFREQLREEYEEPRLVLFTGATGTACGTGQSAMGPFYCPLDKRVYIDLSFYRDMETQLGAPGDFAQAYVVAHEVAHHVQNLRGISGQVHQAQQGASSREEANQLSVMLELQADCLAGVWAFHAQKDPTKPLILDQGEVREALNAASAIGDDRLQKQSQGYVVPESFTHGSSEQRVRWFQRGVETGRLDQCDTFNARSL